MQRNNGAGGSLKNPIKIGLERFVVSFCVSFFKNWLKSRLNPVLKSTCIIPQISIYISKNFSKNIDFNKTPFLTIIEELKGTIINKMAFLTIIHHDSPSLFFKKTLF